MLFWATAALLTLGAALAVMLPFLRRLPGRVRRAEHDIEVYRDQLSEIERDVGRGLIAPAEAEEARAEIGRRILRIDENAAAAGEGTGPTVSSRVVVTMAVLAVPLVSWGIYGLIGSPGLPAQPLQARLAADPADLSVDELVARAEAHLAANPEDGRGWEVLGPVYFRMGRFDDAATAYRNIIRLSGPSARHEAALGEAMVGAARGMVTADAEAAFERALAIEPGHPKARFFIAMALAQEDRTDEARAIWTAMADELPADSPWRAAAGEALAEVGTAAQPQSASERAAMIDAMVAGLDDRLRENPDDPEGWQRLVRSYMVLGRTEDAKDALKRGMAALGEGSENARRLAEQAASLGVPETAEKQ